MDRALLTLNATLRAHARELAAAVRTGGKGISEPHLAFLAGSLELWHKLLTERRSLLVRRIAIRTLAWWAAWTIMLVCLIGFSLSY
jgi:hypothetical protein